MRFCLAVALVVSLVFAGTAGAQFYKYIDKQGNVRFTDDINHVPENQRSKARSYVEFHHPQPPASESGDGAEKQPGPTPGPLEAPAIALDSASADRDSLEAAKAHIEEMKKKLDAEYQALRREEEVISKGKEGRKTREEINDYNKRVEAFNQRAAKYENQSDELRKMADGYNARVIEENAKVSKSAKK
jgi:hypothetical protein